MSKIDEVRSAMVQAMKAGDKETKETLSMLLSALKNKAIDKRADLTEEEETVYRHGRNAKPKTVPKAATVAEYAHATALEALFGWLYLKQRYDRINELFGRIAETF